MDKMKICVSCAGVVVIAAYLRQVGLSIHRADSIFELREFIISRSLSPDRFSKLFFDDLSLPLRGKKIIFGVDQYDIYQEMSKFSKKAFLNRILATIKIDVKICFPIFYILACVRVVECLEEFLVKARDDRFEASRDAVNLLGYHARCCDQYLVQFLPRREQLLVESIDHLNENLALKTRSLFEIIELSGVSL